MTVVLAAPAQAQVTGSWEQGFNHDLTGPAAVNDYLGPFRNVQGQSTGFVAPPTPPSVGGNATANFFWGQGRPGVVQQYQAFNAIHMALIPKGTYQNKILVWGAWFPVRLKPNSQLSPNGRDWYCQAWSIIDPTARTFRNYLLPLKEASTSTTQDVVADLFCVGHAWTQEGDLVVAGGAEATVNLTNIPPNTLSSGGAKFLFLFDPSVNSQPFPGQVASLYGDTGHWQRQAGLLLDRFYPTVTLSQKLARNGLNREVVLIAGGSDHDSVPDSAENTYETYVSNGLSLTNPQSLGIDPDPNSLQSVLFDGLYSLTGADNLEEYPRLHLVRDNGIFKSGPFPLASKVDQSVLASVGSAEDRYLRPWDATIGRSLPPGTPWTGQRHDGASVLLCIGSTDFVVRLGGGLDDAATGAASTDTSEYCKANVLGSNWSSLGVMPGGHRQFPNAVVLPDGSILVIGGADNATATYCHTTVLYRAGIGWAEVAPDSATSPTRRAYHSCAVLLPDGRVFVGGGELLSPQSGSEHDYDIYVPHYLQGDPVRPNIADVRDALGVSIGIDQTTKARPVAGGAQVFVDCDSLDGLASIDRVVLIAPGSITHHSDMSARYVQLPGAHVSNSTMQVQIPNDGSVPRGFYMMFAVNSAGVPSVAAWIKVL